VITATQHLRDLAVPCTGLHAAGLDPITREMLGSRPAR